MKLILVGGFLGAGKTTLLAESARRLTASNHTVGLITNDQVPDLVDTALLTKSGAGVREVAGSCFCCNFDGFQRAVQSLVDAGANCIVAEPVGSCTDLSATIVQPLKSLYPEYAVAPLSVLVDPLRVRNVLQEKRSLLHADAAYILHLQLEEADQILLNKADTLSDVERDAFIAFLRSEFPHAAVATISAATGEGVDAWLECAIAGNVSGARIIEVDYDRYANGEAVLGWLNAVINLRWIGGLEPDWESFVLHVFISLQEDLHANQCEIGHIKTLLEFPEGQIMANLTALDESAQIRREGVIDRLSTNMTVNARAQITPDGIELALKNALRTAAHARVTPSITSFHCIQPGRPVPTHRYDSVV